MADLSIRNILLSADGYIIPIYQRAFAWSKAELRTLVKDIEDQRKRKEDGYYLGTLIVFKRKDGLFEVIDGQQRLTALSLLLIALGKRDSHALFYEARKESEEAIRAIIERKEADSSHPFFIAYGILLQAIADLVSDREEYLSYLLEKVHLMRVEVPKDTNLNRYFEIMNSRGEQLEANEIILTELMQNLTDEREKEALVLIWNAIGTFDGYLQMGIMKRIWNRMYYGDGHYPLLDTDYKSWWKMIVSHLYGENDNRFKTLDEILEEEDTLSIPASEKVTGEAINTSVTDFPHFLLLASSLFLEKDLDTDDKRLITTLLSEEELQGEDNVKAYAFFLLKLRFLFDHYIAKRNENGAWHISKYLDEHELAPAFEPEIGKALLEKEMDMIEKHPDAFDYTWLLEPMKSLAQKPHMDAEEFIKLL